MVHRTDDFLLSQTTLPASSPLMTRTRIDASQPSTPPNFMVEPQAFPFNDLLQDLGHYEDTYSKLVAADQIFLPLTSTKKIDHVNAAPTSPIESVDDLAKSPSSSSDHYSSLSSPQSGSESRSPDFSFEKYSENENSPVNFFPYYYGNQSEGIQSSVSSTFSKEPNITDQTDQRLILPMSTKPHVSGQSLFQFPSKSSTSNNEVQSQSESQYQMVFPGQDHFANGPNDKNRLEIPNEHSTSSPVRNKRKANDNGPEPEDRKAKKLANNRAAAKKSREKKKATLKQLEDMADSLYNKNRQLRATVSDLTEEFFGLRCEIIANQGCPCNLPRQYLLQTKRPMFAPVTQQISQTSIPLAPSSHTCALPTSTKRSLCAINSVPSSPVPEQSPPIVNASFANRISGSNEVIHVTTAASSPLLQTTEVMPVYVPMPTQTAHLATLGEYYQH